MSSYFILKTPRKIIEKQLNVLVRFSVFRNTSFTRHIQHNCVQLFVCSKTIFLRRCTRYSVIARQPGAAEGVMYVVRNRTGRWTTLTTVESKRSQLFRPLVFHRRSAALSKHVARFAAGMWMQSAMARSRDVFMAQVRRC